MSIQKRRKDLKGWIKIKQQRLKNKKRTEDFIHKEFEQQRRRREELSAVSSLDN